MSDISEKDLKLCLKVAKVIALQSSAVRAQVGCVVFNKRSRNIVSIGYNGTPVGDSNVCEENGKTKDTVIHAEVNALKKIVIFKKKDYALCVTHAPCVGCAKAIIKKGIREVYYLYPYGDGLGLKLLSDAGVHVKRVLWDGI